MSKSQNPAPYVMGDAVVSRFKRENYPVPQDAPMVAEKHESNLTLTQWTTDGTNYYPAGNTVKQLEPGFYVPDQDNRGLYFKKLECRTEGLLQFPETNCDKVISEIKTFWDKENIYRSHDIQYKRGIILFGPPGSGKSSTIQLIVSDVIARKGVAIKFENPHLFVEAFRIFRHLQPDTPAVVLMEDIDSIIMLRDESVVLNILDGVESMDKVVFLATTNYPEKLGARIINRPSRFDRRFKMPHPSKASRKMYFEHLASKVQDKEIGGKINIEQWVKDTEDFSISHLKELFVAVCILGEPYDETLEILKSMREDFPSSRDDENLFMGFNTGQKRC